MPVYSMTGYACVQSTSLPPPTSPAEFGPSTATFNLELRSVNSRFLDLVLRLPDEFKHHESTLREQLTSHLRRGKVELRLTSTQTTSDALPRFQASQVQQLGQLQDQVLAWFPHAQALSVSDVLHWMGRSEPSDVSLDAQLQPLLDQAIRELKAAREREGQRLAEALLRRTAQLRELATQAQPLVPLLVEQQQQRFIERWNQALQSIDASGATVAAQERALAEAASFALRIDVAEELTRLATHLDEIDRLLKAGGELGKRLDFLIQELHREANTLGSKSSTLEMTRISVDMKVLIEQMREQVQNIE